MGVLKLDENIKEINHELSNTIEILNFRIDKVKKYIEKSENKIKNEKEKIKSYEYELREIEKAKAIVLNKIEQDIY